MKVTLEIPDQVARALPDDLAGEPRRLLLELAGLDRLDFQQELGLREIPVHYTSEDLAHDIAFARG